MEKEYLEMILEDINDKFDLIMEGYSSLNKKIDKNHQESNEKHAHTAFMLETLNQKIDGVDPTLSAKIDAVVESLSAHRCDTELHRGYQVGED